MKKILGVCMILIGGWRLHAQSNIHELVYSHLSSQDLIVGETLYFSGYAFSSQTGRFSDLSRLLYVELLDSSGNPVDQMKIKLKQGVGSGHIYLPSDLSTGRYHFVAYTRWMKNFKDFYHQAITVVNPYQTPQILPEEELHWSVDFRAEGGTFLANNKNKIVLRVTDQYNQGVAANGKIISKTKDFNMAVKTDEFGFFGAIITPGIEESYQLILEREEGFEFFDLPVAKAGQHSQLKVMTTKDLYIIKLASFDSELYTQGELTAYKNGRMIFSKPAAINTSISLEKKDLPGGLLRLEYKTDANRTWERLIWNGPIISSRAQKELARKKTLELINYSCTIQDSAQLSISIEKVDSPSSMLDLGAFQKLESKLELNLPSKFYDSLSDKSMDELLVFAQWKAPRKMPAEVKWLPEFRHGLVQGQVVDQQGKPAGQVSLALTLPGNSPQMTAAVSDSSGHFVLSYDPLYIGDDPRIALLNQHQELNIQVEPEFYTSYPVFPNPSIVLDSTRIVSLIERSVYNQIENAYHQPKINLEKVTRMTQFDGVKSYRLAEYARFSTIRDTFIELIPEVGVSKNEEDYKFRIRSKDLSSTMLDQKPTLLLLDGALVTDQQVMELSPYLVERIDVLNRRYYFGPLVFDGIISIHTLTGGRGETPIKGSKLSLADISHEPPESVYVKSNKKNSRVPNYQDLLYWNPAVQHPGGQLDFSFFTSEVTGLFEIRIEGITNAGNTISRISHFLVTKP